MTEPTLESVTVELIAALTVLVLALAKYFRVVAHLKRLKDSIRPPKRSQTDATQEQEAGAPSGGTRDD